MLNVRLYITGGPPNIGMNPRMNPPRGPALGPMPGAYGPGGMRGPPPGMIDLIRRFVSLIPVY